jgi:hypothetical protein
MTDTPVCAADFLHEAPDLSTPEKIADSLSALKLSEWRSLTLALPACVDDQAKGRANSRAIHYRNALIAVLTLPTIGSSRSR